MSAASSRDLPVASAEAQRARSRPAAWMGVALWRHGWCWPLAIAALVCAMVAELAVRPALHAERGDLEHQRLLGQRGVISRQTLDVSTDRGQQLGQIEMMLQRQAGFEAQFQQVVEVAARHGIQLPRADYVTTTDAADDIRRVQVNLSVVAPYPRLRAFIEETLRSLPAASLDQLSVKRDNIAQDKAEVALKISFWSVRSLEMSLPLASGAIRTGAQ